MTVNELKTRIANALGVSHSEKELAYDIFISKIAEILTPELTLKIPKLGYFQLKSAEEDKYSEIIYSPIQEDIIHDLRNIFIILELPQAKKFSVKPEQSEDSDIFSIGVGKPYLPLEGELEENLDASYIFLKKSIEERINEILSEAEHIPDLNLWYMYEKFISEEKDTSSERQLTELASDITFDDSIVNGKEDIIAEDITKTLLENEIEESLERMEEKVDKNSTDVTLAELLEGFNVEQKQHEENLNQTEIPSEQKKEQVEESKEIEIELGKHRKYNLDENVKDELTTESQKETGSFNEILENIKKEEETYLGLKKRGPEKIEWNWGDELREELESLQEDIEYEEENYENDFDYYEDKPKLGNRKVDEILKSTKSIPSKLFEELEHEIKKEVEKVTKELNYQNYQTRKTKYEFVEVEQSQIEKSRTLDKINYDNERKYIENEYGFKKEEKYFSRTFIILFSSFIIVIALVIYLLLPNRKVITTLEATKGQNIDTTKNTEQIITAIPPNQSFMTEEDDFPRVPTLSLEKRPVEIAKEVNEQSIVSEGSLYRNIINDTRVYKTIFFDGKSYNVQVSSWRNKIKAEQEAKRLKNAGYDAFVLIANLPEKGGIWYRVRIGSFKTLDEAKDFFSKHNQQINGR
ncbi:MAG: SPOR domain-containing protein [Melioribacter sp.]|nr:SPOR domain-containing protein [Melioribacter sp.]